MEAMTGPTVARIHLNRDLERIRREILELGGLVEDTVDRAILALTERRGDLAREVMEGDDRIDQREVRVEEECLKVLALHQPVAQDLRFIVSVMKVNSDLERMGDLAVNVAERATYLAANPPLPVDLGFQRMGEVVRGMLRESLEALVRLDKDRAARVVASDDEVDAWNRHVIETLEDVILAAPSTVRRGIHAISAARHLERIADLATNVAEDVIFLVDGEVVRHRLEDYVRAERAREARRGGDPGAPRPGV
jgi:phosphate transport system protein